MEPPAGGDATTLKNAMVVGLPGHAGGGSRPLRARAVRRLPRHRRRARPTRRPRPTPRCASRSTTGAGRACRSSSAPASTCRSRRPSCGSSSSDPPRLGFGLRGSDGPSPNQLVVRLDPTTGIRLLVDAQRADAAKPEQINLDMEFAEEGGEGATPYEVLLHAAMVGDSKRFTRQDSVEQTWRVMQPLLDSPPPVHAYAKGSWGPAAADELVAGHGTLARPVGGGMSTAEAPAAAERGGALAVPADRRLRVPVRTATPARSSRPTARSTGCACRASTRRACSARCSTARPARFRLGPVRHQRADGAHLRAGDEHPRHDLEHARPAGSWCATR